MVVYLNRVVDPSVTKTRSRLLPFLWVGVLIICSQSKSCVKEATEHCPSTIVSVHLSGADLNHPKLLHLDLQAKWQLLALNH